MTSQRALSIASRMGERAGRSWIESGIWPRCPFTEPVLADLAAAWTDACFAVLAATPAKPAAGGEAPQ